MSKPTSSTMGTPSSEGAIPATNDNDDEDHAISQKEGYADEPEVAQAMPLLGQAPSATTSIRLPLRRSPSPVADQRISQWKNEKRTFKGTITRKSKGPGAAEAARAAQRSALMVDGQPQFVMFCDGSSAYKPGTNATKDGGYAVVFRDPYDADKAATATASESATATFTGSRNEDGITIGEFTIRHWLSHRTFGNGHTEIAALAQALEEVTKRIDQHQPDTSIVKIFTDFDGSLLRLLKGILTFETTTAANSRKRKRKLTKKEQADTSFFAEHTNPFVQAIVWQSHYLSDRGCTIKINWMPRNTTLGHRLADHMAGQWRWEDPGDAFNQKSLPHHQRDGILDKLHAEVSAIERERAYDALDSQQRPKKRKKIKRASGAKKRSASDYIAALDSPSDYIALDSESEEEPEPQSQPPRKKQKIKGAITAKQSFEEESEPQPQPPKTGEKMKGATTAKQRNTNDFILLDFASDEEPQRPEKRRRIRRATGAKKGSARDHIAPDSPSDYIALDSKSQEKAEPQPRQPELPKKREEIKGATTAQQSSTSDFILLDSDSEEEPKPKPKPRRNRKKIKGATTMAKKRSTVDYILLDSDAEEEPELKPQAPKKRKKIRGAIPAKKKAPMQQQAGPEEGGFLNGEEHDFTFDPGNLPSYPNQQRAIHDPESGHGTPGCLLCYGDDYPWRSGYTGLPSQWALRRY